MLKYKKKNRNLQALLNKEEVCYKFYSTVDTDPAIRNDRISLLEPHNSCTYLYTMLNLHIYLWIESHFVQHIYLHAFALQYFTQITQQLLNLNLIFGLKSCYFHYYCRFNFNTKYISLHILF